jgi:alpha-beta hydrolase superfamily lysophospholipase
MKPRLTTLLIGRWTWYRPLVSLAFIYFLLALFAVFFADRMIFLPPAPSYDRSERNLVFIETAAGETLAAIHHPAATGNPTLLFSHGNAEDIGQLRELFDHWRREGLGVLAYDYPGYGLSTGEPTEASATRAGRGAWDFLTKEKGIPSGDIVIVGRSVGGGPACALAATVDARALVLISPFTSAYAVRVPTWLFPRDRFRNLKLMPGIDEPLLVIHGENDDIIPPSHGGQLYASSPSDAKTWHPVPGAGHNDLFLIGHDLPDVISAFARNPSSP